MDNKAKQWSPPEMADWVRGINQLGGSAGDAGRQLVPIDPESAIAAAVAATGLDDFGDPAYREGLDRLCQGLNDTARLTLFGRLLARADIARTLEVRLNLEKHIGAHPEIEEEVIEAPIFVTGLARTGTSFLHELLWQSPTLRAPLTWEMMYPVEAGLAPEVDPEPTIRRARQAYELPNDAMPSLFTMHDVQVHLPNECIFLFGTEFASELYSGNYDIPDYSMWMATRDLTPLYASHRRQLQVMQAGHPKQRWVLKSPTHVNHMAELFSVYPDARVIVTHRDPLRVLGSIVNVIASLRSVRSDEVDYQALVSMMAFGHAYLAEQVMTQRDSGGLPSDQIIDVRYQDLVGDPVGTVTKISDWLGEPLGGQAATDLKSWVANRPKDRLGVHNYSFADLGLDLVEERARQAAYQERYDIPSEV